MADIRTQAKISYTVLGCLLLGSLTNLSGTGATGVGLTLPDGSLITAARIPHHVDLAAND